MLRLLILLACIFPLSAAAPADDRCPSGTLKVIKDGVIKDGRATCLPVAGGRLVTPVYP